MKKFTAIVHHGGRTKAAFGRSCLEIPGANGQGETKEISKD
jgi:hypothetical protein